MTNMLTAKWTVELSMDAETQHSKDLEVDLSRQIQEEIDWELLSDMMVAVGWVKVELDRVKDRYQAIDIQTWIDDNCKGHCNSRGSTFVFQNTEDAEWFSLRWL